MTTLALLLVTVIDTIPVDRLEVNTWGDGQQQIIAWVWCPARKKFEVAGWKMKNVDVYESSNGRYRVLWKGRIVEAKSFAETHTVHDRERAAKSWAYRDSRLTFEH
jgi:hypothetical protein